ncbi:MAG TPA: HAD-IA family hydrolase [Tenuifilaceae bacterium]|nr:HAD-IA family hydrolase [Tenuifilaceae bacterium]
MLHIITNGFNEVQFTKLELCGLSSYFTKVITSEISGYHKPRPEAFGYTLSSANARKAESIMIGDDLEADILGAKAFGIDQIFFNPNREQHGHSVTHEITSLLELKKIL